MTCTCSCVKNCLLNYSKKHSTDLNYFSDIWLRHFFNNFSFLFVYLFLNYIIYDIQYKNKGISGTVNSLRWPGSLPAVQVLGDAGFWIWKLNLTVPYTLQKSSASSPKSCTDALLAILCYLCDSREFCWKYLSLQVRIYVYMQMYIYNVQL